jgi:hypothetical protein
MTKIDSRIMMRGLKKSILAMVIAICLLCATTALALADTVTISDAAHVLGDGSQVRNEAAKLPKPISIYTTSTFNGTKQQFDQQAKSHISSPNMIVMAIDTTSHHLVIVGGSNVQLTDSQYQDAIQSFVSNYKSGGYISGTLGAIQTLHNYLGSAPVNGGNTNNGGLTAPTTSGGGFFSSLLFPLCCIGLIILVIVGVLFTVGRRMFGFGGRQRPVQQPFNQGYPPNYGGPGYNQGPGMNPWAAGGLGAAAGGLIGYELGKEQGENQGRDPDWNQGQGGQDSGASGDFGGGGGDFGGGAGGDFGGGGGGGGDFGGGGGGGGGGDF